MSAAPPEQCSRCLCWQGYHLAGCEDARDPMRGLETSERATLRALLKETADFSPQEFLALAADLGRMGIDGSGRRLAYAIRAIVSQDARAAALAFRELDLPSLRGVRREGGR